MNVDLSRDPLKHEEAEKGYDYYTQRKKLVHEV